MWPKYAKGGFDTVVPLDVPTESGDLLAGGTQVLRLTSELGNWSSENHNTWALAPCFLCAVFPHPSYSLGYLDHHRNFHLTSFLLRKIPRKPHHVGHLSETQASALILRPTKSIKSLRSHEHAASLPGPGTAWSSDPQEVIGEDCILGRYVSMSQTVNTNSVS